MHNLLCVKSPSRVTLNKIVQIFRCKHKLWADFTIYLSAQLSMGLVSICNNLQEIVHSSQVTGQMPQSKFMDAVIWTYKSYRNPSRTKSSLMCHVFATIFKIQYKDTYVRYDALYANMCNYTFISTIQNIIDPHPKQTKTRAWKAVHYFWWWCPSVRTYIRTN